MNRILVTTLSLLALIGGSAVIKRHVSAERNDTSPLMISVVRADGALIPFAQYGNGGWWNPWPKPRQSAQSIYAESTELIPHSLGELPEPWFKQCGKTPTRWYFWSSADTVKVLSASRPVQVENHSQTNWAMLTELPKETANDAHRIIGVALNVDNKIEPMIEIKPESIEVADIILFVKQTFDWAETEKLNEIRAERVPGIELSMPVLSLSNEERGKVKVSLTKLYRSKSSLNGEHLYYFEAEKQYAKPATATDRDCNDISLFQGWISADGKGELGLMDSQSFLTNCDMKGPSTTTPLGIMTLKNEIFVFVSEHGWEDESYTILELSNSHLQRVLETFGG